MPKPILSLLLLIVPVLLPIPAVSEAGIWISREEVAALPVRGPAWEALVRWASEPIDAPDLSDQGDPSNLRVLARALVFARTGAEAQRREVIDACRAVMGTEEGGRTLALGRELLAYVVAADLVGLPKADDAVFRRWLRRMLTLDLSGRTLVSTHEERPNNWGTHAGASRAAVAVYLGDGVETARVARVFRGWLGDRDAYAGFRFGSRGWQADAARPVGINPQGATREGHVIDGVLPDDQRRAGGFRWPPPRENYVWEALQGALAQAVILHRRGYDVFEWQDRALLRAVAWLHEQAHYPAEGDDSWQPHLINFYYGTDYPAPVPSRPGKNVGFTDWTHPAPPAPPRPAPRAD